MDEPAEKIVRALEAKNWNVPGIKVEFDEYGANNEYKRVLHVRAPDYVLFFCIGKELLDENHYNTANLHMATIPKKELSVFDDHSGPTLSVYMDKNWEKDKKFWFSDTAKTNSKLWKQPRMLHYSGSFQGSKAEFREECGKYTPGQLAPYLLHGDDDREYSPKGKEPEVFETEKVFQEFTDFLNQKLEEILAA